MTAQAQCRWAHPMGCPSHHLSLNTATDLPMAAPYRLRRRSSRRGTYPSVSCISPHRGIGISTDCPSASAGAYALGPTNPPRITRAAEPLGFRWGGFAPPFSVTHSGIRTRATSTWAYAHASRAARRSPTIPCGILGFGGTLCPGTVSAQHYSTSELLRTLSRVAASKPTSWLSTRHHNLSHSASTWGP